MYEDFRNQIIAQLCQKFNQEQMQTITQALDQVSAKFTIQKQSTELAVDGRQQFINILKTFFAVRFTQGMSKSSLKTQQSILKNFIMSMNIPFNKIQANHIRSYIFQYRQQHDVSPRTLELYRTVICGFFKWLASEGYIERDITLNIKPIKFIKNQRKALTQLQMQKVRKACNTQREKALIQVFYSTGCRVSEVSNIKLSDIDWQNKTINVIGKGNKPRTVFISARCQVAVKTYLQNRKNNSDYLFSGEKGGANIKPAAIQRIFGIIAQRAGIEHNLLTPHILRHTFATQALTGSTVQQVQQMLGHQSIATTMIYAEVDKSEIQSAHKRSVI